MTQHVDKYNPVKASYYERKAAREQMDRSGYAAFKEWTKTHSSQLYRKLARDDQASYAWDTYEFMHLEDPAMLTLWDEAEALIQSISDKKHLNEYDLLGIEPGATKRGVKNAYRRMARKLHPDKGGDPEAFKALYAAYRKLLTVAKE